MLFEPFAFAMKLDQFLKWHGVVATGGEAKYVIISGLVSVNGSVETRRGRKLDPGDRVCFGSNKLIVTDTDTKGP